MDTQTELERNKKVILEIVEILEREGLYINANARKTRDELLHTQALENILEAVRHLRTVGWE